MVRVESGARLPLTAGSSCAAQVETPVLETSAGGADARPFTTFHNALQQPYALRIATGKSERSAAPADMQQRLLTCEG